MNRYELLYVIKANLSEEQTAATMEKIAAFMQKNEATIELAEDQGVKRLAYEIQKAKEGRFILVEFSSNPSFVKELNRMFTIEETVIRFMITKK